MPRLKKARGPGVSPRSLVPTQVVPCLERRSVTSSESASWWCSRQGRNVSAMVARLTAVGRLRLLTLSTSASRSGWQPYMKERGDSTRPRDRSRGLVFNTSSCRGYRCLAPYCNRVRENLGSSGTRVHRHVERTATDNGVDHLACCVRLACVYLHGAL